MQICNADRNVSLMNVGEITWTSSIRIFKNTKGLFWESVLVTCLFLGGYRRWKIWQGKLLNKWVASVARVQISINCRVNISLRIVVKLCAAGLSHLSNSRLCLIFSEFRQPRVPWKISFSKCCGREPVWVVNGCYYFNSFCFCRGCFFELFSVPLMSFTCDESEY